MIDVLLVTTWDTACGIAEHSALLVDALKPEDDINITPSNQEALDPKHLARALTTSPNRYQIIHLNYHAALHSRWTAHHVKQVQATGRKVVITYHDTMSGEADQRNSERCIELWEQADAFIVHEPVADLPGAIYWRQGIPEPEDTALERVGTRGYPCLGTVGFDFPWKNYDLLATCSYDAGWALLIVGKVTSDRQKALADLNPRVQFAYNDHGVSGEFVHRRQVVRLLSGCAATAFLYLCANTGTSAAIRQGIAARKPLLATDPAACRQFRDLKGLGSGITWLNDLSPDNVTRWLGWLQTGHDHQMDHFAEQDSWRRLGHKYAALYRGLV